MFRDLFHYTAYHLADIADNARDVDFAIRWGYGWQQGPFEIWQAAGWKQIAAGSPRTSRPARRWRTRRCPHGSRTGATACMARTARTRRRSTAAPRSPHPVYQRQLFPDPCSARSERGTTIFENRRRALLAPRPGHRHPEFKTKMNTIRRRARRHPSGRSARREEARGLVIWQTGEPFSAGADLSGAMER
jgi:3-hydroxyacyl-CoA dehydrogenase